MWEVIQKNCFLKFKSELFSNMISALTKLLVVSGYGLKSVEVVNLDENTPNLVCSNLPDVPIGLQGLTGQLYQGSKPILCGGRNSSNITQCGCFLYENRSWNNIADLAECVWFPSSTTFTLNGHEIFLITGGAINLHEASTVQSYNGSSWNKDNNAVLPLSIWLHCLVKINDSTLLMIGGRSGSITENTFFFDIGETKWMPGPALHFARFGHGCGIIDWFNPVTNQLEKVVFAVGGHNDEYLDTVEMLFLNDQNIENLKWVLGPKLPKTASHGTVVEFNNSIVLVGGKGEVDGRHLYKLSSPNGTWTEMKQTLNESRYYHASFFVPDELVDCN